MPWLYFKRNFEFKPRSNLLLVYRAGSTYLVSQACAAGALTAEVAIPAQRPVGVKQHAKITDHRKANGSGPAT